VDIIHLSGFCQSEFPEEQVNKIAEKHLGYRARLICGSKTLYNWLHPANLVIFNSNVFAGFIKIWYGDIDLTLESWKLENLAKELNCEIFVTYESNGRFGEEDGITFERMEEIYAWRSSTGLSKFLKKYRKDMLYRAYKIKKKKQKIGWHPKRLNRDKIQAINWYIGGSQETSKYFKLKKC